MRNLKDLLGDKPPVRASETALDEKTVFFVFQRAVKEMYGTRGIENILPSLYRDKTLYVRPRSSLWANELSLQRKELIRKVNKLLESEAVEKLRLTQRGS